MILDCSVRAVAIEKTFTDKASGKDTNRPELGQRRSMFDELWSCVRREYPFVDLDYFYESWLPGTMAGFA